MKTAVFRSFNCNTIDDQSTGARRPFPPCFCCFCCFCCLCCFCCSSCLCSARFRCQRLDDRGVHSQGLEVAIPHPRSLFHGAPHLFPRPRYPPRLFVQPSPPPGEQPVALPGRPGQVHLHLDHVPERVLLPRLLLQPRPHPVFRQLGQHLVGYSRRCRKGDG